MNTLNRRGIVNFARAVVPLAAVALGAAVLFLFPPQRYNFYPHCPIYRYFHVQCPGCGTTRVLAALLHGNFAEALHFNALTTLLMPMAATYVSICYCRFVQRKPFRWPEVPRAAVPSALAAAILFAVVRNLG